MVSFSVNSFVACFFCCLVLVRCQPTISLASRQKKNPSEKRLPEEEKTQILIVYIVTNYNCIDTAPTNIVLLDFDEFVDLCDGQKWILCSENVSPGCISDEMARMKMKFLSTRSCRIARDREILEQSRRKKSE